MRYSMYWVTPYDTGNLAGRGTGDLYAPTGINSIGYDIGGIAAPYGALLNNAEVITRTVRGADGRLHNKQYINRHYRWINNFAENFAHTLAAELGGTIING